MFVARPSVVRSLRLQKAIRCYTDSNGPIGSGGTDNSFTKREKANEDYFVRQHEKEQLQRLRQQLKEHQDKVDTIKNKIESLSKK
ncbi:uncharacterized protein TDEL_0H01500 [Torulaspora delbrueckii]|uniref:ATPase inhibitor, mitochondrial n=1 Tax=Torulaspora delbrueckii TaxID=4950 RepID=G8ZZG5_TORDE|nr:hypothetical protein TDEL_0H01500 [Torulaspora delbrueckii]CCE94009.1 hypothetical protein TDEL_0H01500 [Torulaspora delbrueckii]